MQIDLPDDQVGGTFASGASVNYSGEMFLLDFIVIDDRAETPTARVVQRIRVLPTVVQTILQVMSKRLGDYEDQFGSLPPEGGEVSSS